MLKDEMLLFAYIPTAIEEIFKEVLKLTSYVIECVDNVKKYKINL